MDLTFTYRWTLDKPIKMLRVKYYQAASVRDRYVYEKGREDRTDVL